jgi:hypothetical protein
MTIANKLGIEQQLTASYTSAQNGRAECLHQTLMEKARTMRVACNTSLYLWDKFYATAAYLTNLTASSSIKEKTPFELWFGPFLVTPPRDGVSCICSYNNQ